MSKLKKNKNNQSTVPHAITGLSCAIALTCLSSVSFGAMVTNNVIYGSGNINTAWTVSTTENIEVGLRAKVSGSPTYGYDGVDTYTQQAGANASGNALWNFDYSVNLRQSGAGDRNWDDVAVFLEVDRNPDPSIVDYGLIPYPSILFGGNSYGTNATGQGDGVETGRLSAIVQGNYLMQNSQNIGFFPVDPIFGLQDPMDPYALGTYDFRLSVYNIKDAATVLFGGSAQALAQTEMQVKVVPIPAAAWLFGTGLIGLAGIARRKKTA